MEKVNFRLDEDSLADLRAEASKRGVDFSTLMRQLVHEFFRKKLEPDKPPMNEMVLTSIALCAEVLKGAFVENLSREEGDELFEKVKIRVEKMKG